MSAPRFYVSRAGGAAQGPYTVAEIRAQLNAQQLGLDDHACVEGEGQWHKLRDVAAIIPRGPLQAAAERDVAAARAPRETKVAPAAASAAAPARKPPSARSASGYVPGARPLVPGLYLPFAAAPDEIVLQLAALEDPPPPPPDPAVRLRRVRVALTVALLGVSAGACALDNAMEYPRSTGSMLTPFAWLGIIVVFVATRLPTARPAWFKSACFAAALFLLPMMLFGLVLFHEAGEYARSPIFWVLGSIVAILAAKLLGAARPLPGPPDLLSVGPRLALVRKVVDALRHDVAPGKRLSGWLDLTGPDQATKLVRESKAASGAAVQFYRDEWLRLRAPLRDGNELRVSLVERYKARREYWKRNARGKQKRKPGRSQSLRTLEVRLRVNPAAYRVKPAAGESLKIGELTLAAPTFAGDALSVVAQANAPRADEVLGVLAALYGRLEPLRGSSRPVGGA